VPLNEDASAAPGVVGLIHSRRRAAAEVTLTRRARFAIAKP